MSDDQTLGTAVPGPSDAELFKTAMEPPAPAAAPEPSEPAAPVSEPTGPVRDPDTGRFTSRPEETPTAATPQPAPPPAPGQQPPADDNAPIPSWRAREMREQRDAEAARARQYEALLLQQQQELAQMRAYLQQQQKPPEAPQIPDMIVDPQGYHQHMEKQFAKALREQEVNTSFRLAHRDYGELFEHAYSNMMDRANRGDASVAKQVMASPDPGEAMVRWYQREYTLSRVGADPDAWADKRTQEKLEKDPKYREQLYEKLRAMASPTSPHGGPNVQLPPSLNSVAASAPPFTPTLQGDNDIFNDAFRRDPRRAR